MSGEETLLDIARRNLVTAKTMMKLVDADDGYLNVVGYHAQQAIELSIKHYLETHGIKYPMTHDISQWNCSKTSKIVLRISRTWKQRRGTLRIIG